MTWTCASAVATYGLKEGEEEMISYLPVSHIVAQIADIWMIPSIGGTIHFADKNALKGSLLKTLTAVRPTRSVEHEKCNVVKLFNSTNPKNYI